MQTIANLPKLTPAEFWARLSVGHCATCRQAHALLDGLCRDCRLTCEHGAIDGCPACSWAPTES